MVSEGEIEKTKSCGMKEVKWMKLCMQTIQDREPNMTKVYHTVLDGALWTAWAEQPITPKPTTQGRFLEIGLKPDLYIPWRIYMQLKQGL
jgi:hypothetical protein